MFILNHPMYFFSYKDNFPIKLEQSDLSRLYIYYKRTKLELLLALF